MGTVIFKTNGKGYWSNAKKKIKIVDMKVTYCNDEKDFGELRVYFDTADWDVNELGLIYTDNKFLKDLRKFVTAHGLDGKDVDYSEQGMQGNTFVSCDVADKFISSWEAKFGTLTV